MRYDPRNLGAWLSYYVLGNGWRWKLAHAVLGLPRGRGIEWAIRLSPEPEVAAQITVWTLERLAQGLPAEYEDWERYHGE